MGFFSAVFVMLYSLLRLSCRKLGAQSETGLVLCRNGLFLCRNGFHGIINDDFFEEGVLRTIIPILCTAYGFISNL